MFLKMQVVKATGSNIYKASIRHKTYDHIIVGAGSAGCTLANRLTEEVDRNVLLLEAGPKDTILNSFRLAWKIHMPAALTYNLCDKKYNWYYHTTPQKHVNNRVMYWPRGRVWGGSSSLNAMVYIRGHAHDYDRWQEEGADGWDYDHCLPYFKKAQSHELGEDTYRGGCGPLNVTVGDQSNPLFNAFYEAAQEAGYPYTEDMNGYQQEGVGPMDMTIYKGRRWNTSQAYLRPVLDERKNLSTEVNCLVTRVLFEGTRAVGVEYLQNKKLHKVYCEQDVILSGGAINSPQLLMLSGVGNADELKENGICPVANLPGVGQNLQDHLELYVVHKCKKPITLYGAQKPVKMVQVGVEWMMKQTGLGSSAHLSGGGFIRSRGGLTHPDLQFHFLPSQVIDHGRQSSKLEAFQVHVGSLRATSRGWLKLKSNNPKDHPIIEPNYLSTGMLLFPFIFTSASIYADESIDAIFYKYIVL